MTTVITENEQIPLEGQSPTPEQPDRRMPQVRPATPDAQAKPSQEVRPDRPLPPAPPAIPEPPKQKVTRELQVRSRPWDQQRPVAETLPHADGLQRIIRKFALPDFTGLRRTTIDTLIKAGKFPKPIPLGERNKGWLESELIAWQQSLIAKRNGEGGGNG
jgi:prophage regulatory protein